jgi:ribonuclease HI
MQLARRVLEGQMQPIKEGKALLARVREHRRVTFVHVKGHSADGGNDRADDTV